MHDYYVAGTNTYEDDEAIAERAFISISKAQENNIMSFGISSIFELLNNLLYSLDDEQIKRIDKEINKYLFFLQNWDSDDLTKIEHEIYLKDVYAEYLASEPIGDFEKSIDIFDEILALINKSEDDFDWLNWESEINQRKIEIYDDNGFRNKALQLTLKLFIQSIKDYEVTGDVEPLIANLVYLGQRELALGNGTRSALYHSLAFTLISEVSIESIGQNLHWQLDQLIYQLLPSLDCSDSDKVIDFHKRRTDYIGLAFTTESEMAVNSLNTNQLYCEENSEEQDKIAEKIYLDIVQQIDTNILSQYPDNGKNLEFEQFINSGYFMNKLISLYDISDFISNMQYLRVILKIQRLFLNHINSDSFFDDSGINYGYSLILSNGLCLMDESQAKINLNEITGLLKRSDFQNNLFLTPSDLQDLYLDLVLVPSSCGLEKETVEIFDLLIKLNEVFDPFNVIGSGPMA